MLWVPTASVLLVRVAAPLPFNVTGPPTAVPSTLNCTVPVGRAVPTVGATVAVNVTASPKADGFDDEVSVVVVLTPTPVAFRWIVCVDPAMFRELSVTTAEPAIAPATVGAKSIA